jgi:hypothetical protein
MGFQAPISISDAVSRIRERRLLLPAIQREFVWPPFKVEWLFDSLIQDYPIGSFLFWEVRDSHAKNNFRYYEFLDGYRERYKVHNPDFDTRGHHDFDAVLDGQQRLTALYIGLTGTYAYKKARVWWEDSEYAIPTRRLHLNVSGPAPDDDDEPGRKYEFKLLTKDEYAKENEKWFLVGSILDVPGAADLMHLLKKGYLENDFGADALSKLHQVVHTDRVINYYSVQRADLDLALNVFVRINSGGEPLSLSDMLMSTAIANWKQRDARKEFHGLVDQVHGKEFLITKDFVLKACLYLYSSDIRYRASNFSADQVKPFEDHWDDIRASILTAFDLARDFGYTDRSLTSKNALLPIIYWVHHKGTSASISSQVAFRLERREIKRWLHTMLLKGVFGSSADTILAAIRRAFTGDDFNKHFLKPDLTTFPVDGISSILKSHGKDPAITDDFINALLATSYQDRQGFTILSLLSPELDYKNGDFHEDHLHPASCFREAELLAAAIPKEELDFYTDPKNYNSILNLRHLDSNENKSKQSMPLASWAEQEAARQKVSVAKFCMDHQLPTDPEKLLLSSFRQFIEERRATLSAELRRIL